MIDWKYRATELALIINRYREHRNESDVNLIYALAIDVMRDARNEEAAQREDKEEARKKYMEWWRCEDKEEARILFDEYLRFVRQLPEGDKEALDV